MTRTPLTGAGAPHVASATLADAFADSPHAVLIADDERRYVGANDAACRLLRHECADLLRMRIDDLAPPELRGSVDDMWRAFLAEGHQSGSFVAVRADGSRVDVDYFALANVRPGEHVSMLLEPLVELADDALRAGDPLTARERDVLRLAALGGTTGTIAGELGVSVTTVKTHVRNAMDKLEARTRVHAVALALGRGEISI
jgi:PAS domain S-box-containing protein